MDVKHIGNDLEQFAQPKLLDRGLVPASRLIGPLLGRSADRRWSVCSFHRPD